MPQKIPVALQMYTVRDDAASDLDATFAAIAQIGYTRIEIAGYAGKTAAGYQTAMRAHGLSAVGAHVGFDLVRNASAQAIDDAQLLGYKYVVVPWIGAPYTDSIDGYRRLGDELRAVSGAFSDAGLTLCYHNHAFEFEKTDADGAYGYDVLFDAAGPSVEVEMDTFWVKKGGLEPAEYLRRYAGRVPIIHLKDMTADGDFAPVGAGTIDYVGSLLPAAEEAGAQFYVVEQDRCTAQTPLESVRISYNNLKAWGVV